MSVNNVEYIRTFLEMVEMRTNFLFCATLTTVAKVQARRLHGEGLWPGHKKLVNLHVHFFTFFTVEPQWKSRLIQLIFYINLQLRKLKGE